jgi:hypothetical protein
MSDRGCWQAARKGLGLLAALAIVLGACRTTTGDQAADVMLGWTVTPDPPMVGTAVLTLTLKDAQNQILTGVALEVEGNMSHPGMRPVQVQTRERAPGQYEASLEFTMAGDWIISVRATLPDGRRLERELDLRGVRAP